MKHRTTHEITQDLLKMKMKLDEGQVDERWMQVAIARCLEGVLYLMDGQPIQPGFITEERVEIARKMKDHF